MRADGMGWREKVRLVATTAAVTSVGWIMVGALWLQERPAAPPVPATRTGNAPAAAPAPARDGALVIPVEGVAATALSDTFTQAREGGLRSHDAIDIAAPLGTPVLAAAGGTVEKLFDSQDGGRTIYVRLPGGATMHYYAHLDAYAPGLAEGRQVAAGEVIGTVGASGNADPAAPHLHFAVLRTAPGRAWHEGEAVNPYPLLTGAR